jgi:alpha-N-arabinofuranosidase
LLISLLNHADRVRMACLAQLVNVIAPITTEPGGRSWRQPIFFPFADVAARARGQALRVEVRSTRHATRRYGEVDSVVAAATLDDANGELTLFVANRALDAAATLELDLAGALAGYRVTGHRVLHGADPDLRNGADQPDAVRPVEVPVGDPVRLEPVSWNVLRCTPEVG